MLLGLHALKDLGAKRVQIFGDSELVVNQVNDNYQTRHPRMKAYQNEVWDMFKNYFTKHTVQVIPRYKNMVVDSLATAAEKFEAPTARKRKYKVDFVNRPSIPNNTRYWKVFEEDMYINIFLEFSGEIVNTRIDENDADFENFLDVEEEGEEAPGAGKLKDSLGGRDIV